MQQLVATYLKPILRALGRDIGDSQFLIIGVALIVAVASVSAVDVFTDRVQNALLRQSSALLAADVVITGSDTLDETYTRLAHALALQTAQTRSMRSVVAAGDALQLVELKAVDQYYPLRGNLLSTEIPFAKGEATANGPNEGAVWVEQRLLSLMQLQIGDRLKVGASELQITRILVLEPDRGGDLFNIAPRVMMNIADLADTELIGPGSRVNYSLLIAGSDESVARFESELVLNRGDRRVSPANARPEIKSALRRAEQYLGLAAFTTIVLAGVAIALAARSFARNHRDTVALLRTLGASRRYVMIYFSVEIVLLGLLASSIGALLGFAGQEFIARSLSGWTQSELPPASLWPALRASATALVALAGFALPQIINLSAVPPVRVLRSDANAPELSRGKILTYALAASVFLAPWRSDQWQLTAWSILGLAIGLVLFLLAARLLLALIARGGNRGGFIVRLALANVGRRGALSVVQITGLGLSLTALLVLAIIRNDLLDSWLSSLPPNAPNQFLINIQAEDVDAMQMFFAARGLSQIAFYPMVRARLIAHNDEPITATTYADPRAQRLADREFNLSAARQLKTHNKLVAGEWWLAGEAEHFSVERDIAKTLGIKLGDRLTYRVADQVFSGHVSNFRAVQWDSMEVNFFVEAPPALLDGFPATFITSFYVGPSDDTLLPDLVAAFPSVTVIDIAALVTHVRAIMQRSATTIGFVFLFTLGAGILVLIAAVQATQGERIFESALYKTLGIARHQNLKIMGLEFLAIGVVAGLVAGLTALVAAWLVATRVLELDYSPDLSLLAIGIVAGIASVGSVGCFAVAHALDRPAASVLRYRG